MKIILILLIWGSAVQAQNYLGAVSSATANTGRGAAEVTDSAFINPASLAFNKGYYFSSSYTTVNSDTFAGTDYSFSLIDNMKDTVVPTGLSYAQLKHITSGIDLTTRDFRLSLGNFYSRNLSLGFTVHHKEDENPTNRFQQTNFSTGLIYTPKNNIGIGVTLDDIMDADKSVPKDLQTESRTGLGISYIYQSFARFRADLVSAPGNSFIKPTISGGLESYMNKWIILRLGIGRDFDEDTDLYSGGLGFKGPRFGVHYSYQKYPKAGELARHSIDLAVPIW